MHSVIDSNYVYQLFLLFVAAIVRYVRLNVHLSGRSSARVHCNLQWIVLNKCLCDSCYHIKKPNACGWNRLPWTRYSIKMHTVCTQSRFFDGILIVLLEPNYPNISKSIVVHIIVPSAYLGLYVDPNQINRPKISKWTKPKKSGTKNRT